MKDKIELETVGEILLEEFMKPKELTILEVATAIFVKPIDLLDIVFFDKILSEEFDRRLTKYFGLSEGYFLRLQEDYKQRKVKK